MSSWLETLVTTTVTLFLIVEPFAALPVFVSVAGRRPARELPRLARRASLAGALVLTAFALAGRSLLGALGVSLDAVRAAGGLILALTALDILRGRPSSCRCTPGEAKAAADGGGDVALVPLAIPLLAGPGAIATVVTQVGAGVAGASAAVLVAIALVFLATYAILRAAGLVRRLVGPAVLGAVERVLGLVLAAMAAQLVADGVRGLV